jgi:hypothetical protein
VKDNRAGRSGFDRLAVTAQREYRVARSYARSWVSIPTWGMFARNVRAVALWGKPFRSGLERWAEQTHGVPDVTHETDR